MPIGDTLRGLRHTVEFRDLLHVDVSFSADKKSFDARAILRSTYHRAFLERRLASLPAATDQEGEQDVTGPTGRARRGATPAEASPTAEITLKTHNLTIGPSPQQLYPSRLVSISLDGASVNLGHKAGVVALLKQEVASVIGVHAVAHVLELSWADALNGEPLIDEMLETNQMAYVHYAGSGKKKLSYHSACTALGEDENELISLHGIRWRESSHRAAKNLLTSWKARTLDLLEEASTEIGLSLTPLSPQESFIGLTFLKKTDAGMYGTGELTFVLKVVKFLGKTADNVNNFQAKYMRVLKGRACCGEVEPFLRSTCVPRPLP